MPGFSLDLAYPSLPYLHWAFCTSDPWLRQGVPRSSPHGPENLSPLGGARNTRPAFPGSS